MSFAFKGFVGVKLIKSVFTNYRLNMCGMSDIAFYKYHNHMLNINYEIFNIFVHIFVGNKGNFIYYPSHCTHFFPDL